MYIIGPVRTAHFGRCRSFPNRFRIRRKAAADLGGGYFFRSTPNLIAAITSISNAMVSAVLMRSPPLRGNNRTALTGEPYFTRSALLCQFSAPPAGRLLLCVRFTPCFTQNASEALWDLPEDWPSGFSLERLQPILRNWDVEICVAAIIWPVDAGLLKDNTPEINAVLVHVDDRALRPR